MAIDLAVPRVRLLPREGQDALIDAARRDYYFQGLALVEPGTERQWVHAQRIRNLFAWNSPQSDEELPIPEFPILTTTNTDGAIRQIASLEARVLLLPGYAPIGQGHRPLREASSHLDGYSIFVRNDTAGLGRALQRLCDELGIDLDFREEDAFYEVFGKPGIEDFAQYSTLYMTEAGERGTSRAMRARQGAWQVDYFGAPVEEKRLELLMAQVGEHVALYRTIEGEPRSDRVRLFEDMYRELSRTEGYEELATRPRNDTFLRHGQQYDGFMAALRTAHHLEPTSIEEGSPIVIAGAEEIARFGRERPSDFIRRIEEKR